ncbi:MPRIP protein, partial [Atractosteus spatula]|nr:MPRIP protein [Atractosteus spatula]
TMSSKENPCRKFQANIFNKSKCQNCFKPRESHLLNDEDLNQAKPIYGGWLLLAPEGTDFDNPVHRSRKWQRRFFILYEHGLLRYALDEMPSTLPQGTINMNQCSDVIDGEARTGQKNSLCILTPDKEHFIRAENKEIINGWLETLIVYPRTNKQNLKKKRKVEPPTPQEPGPAKVAVTSSSAIPSIPSVEKVPASKSTLWQEERRGDMRVIPCSRSASCLSQLSQACPSQSATAAAAREGVFDLKDHLGDRGPFKTLINGVCIRLQDSLKVYRTGVSDNNSLSGETVSLKFTFFCNSFVSETHRRTDGLESEIRCWVHRRCMFTHLVFLSNFSHKFSTAVLLVSGTAEVREAVVDRGQGGSAFSPRPAPLFSLCPEADRGAAPSGRKARVESGYFSLEKPKPEKTQPPLWHKIEKLFPQEQRCLFNVPNSSPSGGLWINRSLVVMHCRSHTCMCSRCCYSHINLQYSGTSSNHSTTVYCTVSPVGQPLKTFLPLSPSSGSKSGVHQSSRLVEQSFEQRAALPSHSALSGCWRCALLASIPSRICAPVPSPGAARGPTLLSLTSPKLSAAAASPLLDAFPPLRSIFISQNRSSTWSPVHLLRSQVIDRFETLEAENAERMETSSSSELLSSASAPRQSRSERRPCARKQEFSLDAPKERSIPDVSTSAISPYRRAKSLDRRATESNMTPDLLNFKKGWMTKLYEDGLWKKHWFVLTDQSLRYYRDSVAEEAADLDGEIDLATCFDVTEFAVQRNYGFQIHTKEGAFTLSAMTSGIRRNWIQAIMKNVRPTTAPDVTRCSSWREAFLEKAGLSHCVTFPIYVTIGSLSRQIFNNCLQSSNTSRPNKSCCLIQTVVTVSWQKIIVVWDQHCFKYGEKKRLPDYCLSIGVVIHLSRSALAFGSLMFFLMIKSGGCLERDSQPCRLSQIPVLLKPDGTSGTVHFSSHTHSNPSLQIDLKIPLQDTDDILLVLLFVVSFLFLCCICYNDTLWLQCMFSQPLSYCFSWLPCCPRKNFSLKLSVLKSRPIEIDPFVSRFFLSVSSPNSRLLITHCGDTFPCPSGKHTQNRSLKGIYHCLPLEMTLVNIREMLMNELLPHWHQVETTPLREEKQVPIATLHTCEPGADRLPPQELAALLDKELEQTQKVLAKLQDQNSLLQEQLKEARGREQSAREGYVLQNIRLNAKGQNDSSTSPTGAWQRLHKLNQDLQNELEAQRQRHDLTSQQVQALKRSYSEAKDVIRHHESEIQILQTKLNNAMAEILISEQTVAKMRSELKMEQEKFKERMEEWEHNEQTLQTQLKDSEDRLKDVEALLLEKTQALRDLERQQALQKDYLKEVQKLQDRLKDVTSQLTATEQAQALKEERLSRNCEILKESLEKEKQSLSESLAEAEGKARELEDRLQEAELQVEDLLKEKRATGLESSEVVHQLEEQLAFKTATIHKLTENIHELEEEKDQLTCRCQELINQITEADNEVAKLQSRLKTEETDYYNLEHSFEKVSEEFQKINRVLREKEEEIREAKEMYEKLVEKKEQDLNEALVKMAALGSSLEETEFRLRAKEELLSKMGHVQVEASDSERDLQAKLEMAEDRITELEQHLSDLQLGYADLQMENSKLQEDCDVLESMQKKEESSSPVESLCCIKAVNAKYEKALACVELSREKVQSILKSHKDDSTDKQLQTLSEIETELVNATIYIQQGGSGLEEQQLQYQETLNKEVMVHELSDEDKIKLFAKTLAFEALVLNKMAFSIQNPNLDLLQGLSTVCQEAEKLKRSDESYVAIAYADVLTQKLILESEFWGEVEKLKMQFKEKEEVSQGVQSSGDNLAGKTDSVVMSNACIKAELAFAVENLKQFYERKLQKVKEDLLEAHRNLEHRDHTLKAIVKAYKMPEFDRVIQEVSDEFSGEQGRTLADISPPELAPYLEQIKMEEAHNLAEQIVDKHLQRDLPSCSIDAIEPPLVGRDKLADELKRQAGILQHLSQEMETTCNTDKGIGHHRLMDISCVPPSHRHISDSSSLFMREAMVQAQIAYVACKLRADHERDLKECREACKSMDVLCQEHAKNVNAIRKRYESSLQEERRSFAQTVSNLKEENEALKGEVSQHMAELSLQQERLVQMEEHFRQEMEELKNRYEQELHRAEEKRKTAEAALKDSTAESQRKLEVVLLDIENTEDRHEAHIQKLEDNFHSKIQELQRIHEEEMQHLHSHYTQTIKAMQETVEKLKSKHPEDSPAEVCSPPKNSRPAEKVDGTQSQEAKTELDSMTVLRERIQELETQMNAMRDELEHKHLEGDVSSLREKYQKDFENLKATCERGFAAMEETHQKVIEDIQRQHQREICKLLEERERLLAEETAATIAVKNAHREELEKTQRSQITGMNSDIEELRKQYEEELQSIHRELEVLSEQYSQKCLENAHLAQALEAERQALRQCQRENQELNAHNQELNNRLAAEITRLRSSITGEEAGSPLTHGKDIYELEVLLRVKESEIQYLKQEIHSLKDELQSALRDKKYATDKYKDIYTELSIVRAKAECDIMKLKEQLMVATEALGEKTAESTPVSGYDIMKSKSNPDFLKKERSSVSRQIRGVRSKVSHVYLISVTTVD